jgi:hypothetical protein
MGKRATKETVVMNSVWEFEHSLECDATSEFAWDFWTTVANWKRVEGDAVEWIEMDGQFAVGTRGSTKSPGQEPRNWQIAEVDVGKLATIQMTLDGAVFATTMKFESLSEKRTRITQRMALTGDVPAELLEGIRTFEATAPQGLAKMVSFIEQDQLDRDAGEHGM